MPQLPSGLHIAVDAAPLRKLIDETKEGIKVARLLAIEKIPHLFPYIDVIFFREVSEPASAEYYRDTPPPSLEPYPSGYTLSTISPLVETWSEADRSAFFTFIGEAIEDYLTECLEYIQQLKEKMASQPYNLANLQALWWKLDCHPFQEEAEELEKLKQANKEKQEPS